MLRGLGLFINNFNVTAFVLYCVVAVKQLSVHTCNAVIISSLGTAFTVIIHTPFLNGIIYSRAFTINFVEEYLCSGSTF